LIVTRANAPRQVVGTGSRIPTMTMPLRQVLSLLRQAGRPVMLHLEGPPAPALAPEPEPEPEAGPVVAAFPEEGPLGVRSLGTIPLAKHSGTRTDAASSGAQVKFCAVEPFGVGAAVESLTPGGQGGRCAGLRPGLRLAKVRFGRIAVSEIEAPILLVNLV
jgi:hypothetical protein